MAWIGFLILLPRHLPRRVVNNNKYCCITAAVYYYAIDESLSTRLLELVRFSFFHPLGFVHLDGVLFSRGWRYGGRFFQDGGGDTRRHWVCIFHSCGVCVVCNGLGYQPRSRSWHSAPGRAQAARQVREQHAPEDDEGVRGGNWGFDFPNPDRLETPLCLPPSLPSSFFAAKFVSNHLAFSPLPRPRGPAAPTTSSARAQQQQRTSPAGVRWRARQTPRTPPRTKTTAASRDSRAQGRGGELRALQRAHQLFARLCLC